MNLYRNLNLNQLGIFISVYRNQGMTAAALELNMTQSGVSQHIKALESSLNVKLFDRVKHTLVPTSAATKLYVTCEKSFKDIESGLVALRPTKGELSGTVTIGLPVEFGNNVILPLLSNFSQKNSLVRYRIIYDFATVLAKQLLSGEIDFAFVDSVQIDRRIDLKVVYKERLQLCVASEYLREKKLSIPKLEELFNSKDGLKEIEFLDYQIGEPILRMWFEHHMKSVPKEFILRVVAMDVHGMSRLIVSGMGLGVVPGHLVSRMRKEESKIHILFEETKPLLNNICLAEVEGKTLSLPAKSFRDFLLSNMQQGKRP